MGTSTSPSCDAGAWTPLALPPCSDRSGSLSYRLDNSQWPGVARHSIAEGLSHLALLLLRDDPPDRVAASKLKDRADMIQSRAQGDPGMPPPDACT
jgi:hypothetical protein